LSITINDLSQERYAELLQLKSLRALTIFCNTITVSDFENDLTYFEIAYKDNESLPNENLLSSFSLSEEALIQANVKGNIEKMIRIKNEDSIFELFNSDSFFSGDLYEQQERKVFVYNKDSMLCESILDASAEVGMHAQNRLQLMDVNFDGETDLLIDNGHFGTQGAVTYTCFLKEGQSFTKNESFSEIVNPAIDSNNNKVLSTWRNWAASHSFAMYDFQNNQFVMTHQLTEEPLETAEHTYGENVDKWQWTVETFDGENLTQTEFFTSEDSTEDEINAKLYAEDSFWALASDKWNTLYNLGKMAGFSIYGSDDINETIYRIISGTTEVTQSETAECYTTANLIGGTLNEGLHDTITCDPFLTDLAKKEIINAFLKEHNTYNPEPDGISKFKDSLTIEYYADPENNKMSFVIHSWHDYFNRETDQTVFTDAIMCATLRMDDLEKMGTLTTSFDKNGDVVSKQLANEGEELAYYLYENRLNIPFPFILEERLTEAGQTVVYGESEFFHPYWLYKENAAFDEEGKWTAYQGDIHQREELDGSFQCEYDDSGRLTKIDQAVHAEDDGRETLYDSDSSSEVEMTYYENGALETVHYWRSSMLYGTWHSSGTKEYDEGKRLITERYYVTHGSHQRFYLYQEDRRTPWVCIDFCSMAYSGDEEKGTTYGHDIEFILLK
jgi:hypothetical protein